MGFSAEWLALRAEADAVARDVALMAALAAHLAKRPKPLIVEIGCGAGALGSALERWTPIDARWRLVDNDAALLDRAAAARPDAEKRLLDLDKDLAAALDGADAVVASAFFDLASADWIERFAAAAPADACVYAALTYDGSESWSPPHDSDATVLEAFAQHMRREKGLGIALGPDAAPYLATRLARDGRPVLTAPSPWTLTAPRDAALMSALADGVASAVAELEIDAGPWRAAARTGAVIGHVDVFAGSRPAREAASVSL